MSRVGVGLVVGGALLFVSCGEDRGPPYRPMVDVKTLMIAMVDPAADVLWDAVGTIITMEGVDEWYPETDEEWAKVRNAAIVLMESGNLLMMGDRARDQETWMRLSLAMIDAGEAALEAAEARDPEQIFAIGEKIYFSCDRCHGLYWIGDEDRGRIRETPRSRGETNGE